MKWRAFHEFEESRVRAEMKDPRADIEIAMELSARYLETLRNIVGCFAAMYRDARSTEIQDFVEHLSEAYAAVDVLGQIGGTTWHHLPSTAECLFLYAVQQRVRHVIRAAPSPVQQMTKLD